jgi:ankyrin repeat protein
VTRLLIIIIQSADWAVQNAKLQAAQFLIANFDVDVLAKNAAGRSVLTEAFQTGNTDLIELCLSHPTSSEERLIAVDGAKVAARADGSVSISSASADAETVAASSSGTTPVRSSAADLEAHAVTHRLAFLEADLPLPARHLVVRELPIDHADNPFGTDVAPELDTTGKLPETFVIVDLIPPPVALSVLLHLSHRPMHAPLAG